MISKKLMKNSKNQETKLISKTIKMKFHVQKQFFFIKINCIKQLTIKKTLKNLYFKELCVYHLKLYQTKTFA